MAHMNDAPPNPKAGRTWLSASRSVAEFVVTMVLAVLVFWEFGAKPYAVPTGSMALTLRGRHKLLVCPDCRYRFALGVDEHGRYEPAQCPNCGQTEGFRPAEALLASGDRLLVNPLGFDWRPPRRWELVVFRNPSDPAQAYVKRVVGLPGEQIQICDGDVHVNGRIARKTLDQLRRMRVSVFDNNRQPTDARWRPRWLASQAGQTGWRRDGDAFVQDGRRAEAVDWLEYRHRVRSTVGLGADSHEFWLTHDGELPILDSYGYNGIDRRLRANRVGDVCLACDLEVLGGAGEVVLAVTDGVVRFTAHLAVGRAEARLADARGTLLQAAVDPLRQGRPVHLELALFDRRLAVAADGRLVFGRYHDFQRPTPARRSTSRPVAIGARGVRLAVRNLRLYRDIHYTAVSGIDRAALAVKRPLRLGEDEYFVLGDNSPISNDSRYWPRPPLLRAGLLLGRPFLLHLPSRAVGVNVFGRAFTLSLPDVARIGFVR